jgi:subtilisin-like proprotein convertase family protein
MVAALFLVMIFPSIGFSDPVHIYSGDFNLPIPAQPGSTKGWMDDKAIIEIHDHFPISDLDVGISLTHSRVFDLQLYLQDPTERLCLNMYNFDEYFNGENYTQTIFDDEAELSIEQGQPPFTGRFRPVEPYKLSEFDGEDAYGSWRLQIYDAWEWDTGTFNRFELMITAPEPATAILLSIGVGLMRLRRPQQSQKIINCQNPSSQCSAKTA